MRPLNALHFLMSVARDCGLRSLAKAFGSERAPTLIGVTTCPEFGTYSFAPKPSSLPSR